MNINVKNKHMYWKCNHLIWNKMFLEFHERMELMKTSDSSPEISSWMSVPSMFNFYKEHKFHINLFLKHKLYNFIICYWTNPAHMIKHSVADSISTTVCCFLISFAPRTAVLILCAFCLFADPLVSVQEALLGGDTDADVWYPSDYIQYMTVWC
jgi:hypothetical protein